MSPRVLIVDDEPALLRTFERVLVSIGCEVVTAADAEVAYAMLDGMDVDLILLDLHLRQMAGDTFFLAAIRRWPHLAGRIVMMTGDPGAEKDHWPDELRRTPLLLKPFTIDVLRRTVEVLLAGREPDERRASQGS